MFSVSVVLLTFLKGNRQQLERHRAWLVKSDSGYWSCRYWRKREPGRRLPLGARSGKDMQKYLCFGICFHLIRKIVINLETIYLPYTFSLFFSRIEGSPLALPNSSCCHLHPSYLQHQYAQRPVSQGQELLGVSFPSIPEGQCPAELVA